MPNTNQTSSQATSRASSHVAVARQLIASILASNVDGVDALYHEDARIWRNIDGRELTKAEMLTVVQFLTSKVQSLAYEDVVVQPTPTGFVQQHTLKGIAPNGEPVNVHACVVATIEDAKIRRLDEYMDSGALKPLLG